MRKMAAAAGSLVFFVLARGPVAGLTPRAGKIEAGCPLWRRRGRVAG